MKNILILLLIFISFNGNALTIGERRKAILNVINQELKELTRLNKQRRSRNPKLLLRIAELYLEKARHIKEVENIKYLKLSTLERKKVDKRDYFKQSSHYLGQAQKTCLYILNRFRSFKKRGDVYYILAYNAKEFGNAKNAEKYFRLAVKFSKNDSKISNKSRLALADIYYNKRDYNSAIRLYTKALRKKKFRNKWYTKDAYNLSWSYFRVGQKDKAISLMKEIHKLSKDQYYVDMSSNVERDLSYFYTDAGKTNAAIKFFKKKGKDVEIHLIKVAKHLKNQGKFTTAQKSFVEALKYTKDNAQIADIHSELLSIYEKFFNVNKHLKSTQILYSLYTKNLLNADQVQILKYHLQKMSATLQKRVVGKHFKRRQTLRKERGRQAVKYFKMLTVVDSQKSHYSYFHAAETYFTIGEFNKSVELYDKAFELSKNRGDKKFERLSFEGMMSALGSRGITKTTNDKYLVKAYIHFLRTNPSSKKSDLIYQRLFSNYYENKDIKKAENILMSYRNHFRRNYKIQEAMLAKIMDHYKENNDFKGIRRWSSRIKNGQFVVSPKYAKKLKALILSMQFKDVEKARTKGDQVLALKMMVQIYRDPGSRKDAKKNAAYNIMLLFHKLGHMKLTYEWAKKALAAATPADVKSLQKSYIVITTEFLNRRHFKEAFNINLLTLKKLCKSKSKNTDVFFKNATVTALADDQDKQMIKLVKIGHRCGVSKVKIRDANFDLMFYYKENRRWKSYQSHILKLEKDKSNWPLLISEVEILKNETRINSSAKEIGLLENKMRKFYKYASSRNLSIPLEGLTAIANLKERKIQYLQKKLQSIKLEFPEKKFNRLLKTKINMIGNLTEATMDLLKTRSGVGIVKGYRYLVENYTKLGNEILNVDPTGKSAEYVTTFKKAMLDTVKPLFERAQSFKRQAKSQIISNDILTKGNLYFVHRSKLPFNILYAPPREGVLMDRGGRR